MRKFTKITLIIVAILAVFGLGFVIAGSVTAGGVGVLAAQLRSGEMNFGNWHFEDGVYYNGDVKIDVTNMVEDTMELLPVGSEQAKNEFSESITKLEFDTDLANITIKNADVEQLTVTLEDGYVKYYDTSVNEDTLHISYDVAGHTFKQGPKITVEVPEEMILESIYVDNDLGDVRVIELEQPLVRLEIDAALGNVFIQGCKVREACTVTAALGNIVIEDSVFRKIDMSADMGNIEFSGTVEGDITAQADMGNIEVELEGKEEDYSIELEADMGEVTYEGQKQSGRGGSFSCHQENAVGNITLNCDMGNVELSFDE